jgi:hypothetical protein
MSAPAVFDRLARSQPAPVLLTGDFSKGPPQTEILSLVAVSFALFISVIALA